MKVVLKHFTELDFVTKNIHFIDPWRCGCICCDMEIVLHKFNSTLLYRSAVLQEYSLFRNDDTLDVLPERSIGCGIHIMALSWMQTTCTVNG